METRKEFNMYIYILSVLIFIKKNNKKNEREKYKRRVSFDIKQLLVYFILCAVFSLFCNKYIHINKRKFDHSIYFS